MRAVRYHSGGDESVLKVENVPRPSPTREEVLIDVRAASVNPVDAKRRQRGAGKLPKTTGSDFSGVVEEVGPGVDRFTVGDRVFGTGLHANRFQQGSFAEYIAVPVDVVASLPDSISFEDGAAVALVGVTAWRALVDHGRLKPAETCLIHGGSGGVGHVAVQLGAAIGATVFATAGSDAALRRTEELGADVVLEYEDDDLVGRIRDVADDGVDVIADHRCDEYLSSDVRVASFGGRIVVYGGSQGRIPNAGLARSKNLFVGWMSMSNLAKREGSLPTIASVLRRIAVLFERSALKVDIARRYGLDEAADAHRAVMNDSFVGKLVVRL